jgi:hypothetical protein
MRTPDNDIRRRRLLLLALPVLALTTAVGSAAAKGATGAALPQACKLLTRSEAQTLAGIKLQRPNDLGRGCMYTSDPNGPVAQVEIYVDSTTPRTLLIDRNQLHHPFWKVPRLGDQALIEQGYIFVRKGTVWITIHLVPHDIWPAYRTRLERAAAIAVSRVKSTTRRTAALRWPAGLSRDPPASGGRERWSGKERRYGGSITRYDGVVYQPGVVLIGGGANAIRAESPDGLTWTIDASAPGAADLQVGKIMLATTFATGRVLKLTRVGLNLRVVLGPVALTDVIRDGTFESTAPIPLRRPLLYETSLPTKPAKLHRKTQSASAAAVTPNAFSATTPFFSQRGVGVSIRYDNGGTGRLAATVELYLGRPTVTFRIRIGAGRLLQAGFQLHGVGGLHYDIFGATMDSSGNVNSGPIPVSRSFTIPLTGPLAVTLTQAFDVSMQLAGRGTLRTQGDYAISGTLGFGYGNGRPQAEGVAMSTRTGVTDNSVSLAVGENAFRLRWKLHATVGIGLAGFSAGAWFKFEPTLALAADGSHLNSLKLGCVTAALDVSGYYGVGYTIPNYVRGVVNALLGLVRAKPIPASGGPWWGPYTIWHPQPAEYCPPRK